MSSEAVVQNYLDDARSAMRAYKKLADKAIAQMQDEEFFVTLDEEANSVAVSGDFPECRPGIGLPCGQVSGFSSNARICFSISGEMA